MGADADVLVVGAGLAGLVAAAELSDAGRSVIVLDQEPEQSLGGQAFWSFGGLFLVNSPEQRRLRIKDSAELALQDWLGTAGFDREEDYWPRLWAEAYIDFAAGEKRPWLHAQGMRFFPVVGWAERGGQLATGQGNSVPRFHVTWGTGPGVLEPFVRRVRQAEADGLITFKFRHQVDELITSGGVVDGVRGSVLEPSAAARGTSSSRTVSAEFELHAQAVIVTSGGIGGNHELVRKNWPARLGSAPARMVSGVPAHVDGRMLAIAQTAGAHLINAERMWHYTEGLENWDPIWPNHGIRILPGPSSVWLDARGQRLPVPLFPGFDTLGTLAHIMQTGYEYTWFILTRKIIEKEFNLSGSEQNPDLTGKSVRDVLARVRGGAPGPVAAFLEHGADFVQATELSELVAKMNRLVGSELLDVADIRRQLEARDREIDNPFTKDLQVTAIRGARRYLGDKVTRVATPHRILDPKAGPLIAVRLNILTRKSLGGLETDLSARVLREDGDPVPGLYAAGEAAGFGGGGVHGYRSLEGTFLGGCIFSGRSAGRAAATGVNWLLWHRRLRRRPGELPDPGMHRDTCRHPGVDGSGRAVLRDGQRQTGGVSRLFGQTGTLLTEQEQCPPR
ncbi:FAD-binding dehydrogenase [soil metagenome]